MGERNRVYAAIGVAAIVILGLGLLFVSQPQSQPFAQVQYLNLQQYPAYYYANFTVPKAGTSVSVSITLSFDYGGHYCTYYLTSQIYNLLPTGFQESFNITQADESGIGPNGAMPVSANTQSGTSGLNMVVTLSSGSYIFVFWIKQSTPESGWSAGLTISTSTITLPSQ